VTGIGAPVRTLLVWCPDWPVVAAGIDRAPVAVLHANRVVACSPEASANGVVRGLRRREAQSRCPHLVTVGYDPGRDARAFEPVVAAVEQVAAGVEVIRPGTCALAAHGPARYFGGEERAAERIVEQVAQECEVEAQVGIADGIFAAGLAARAARIVPPGRSGEFLAGLDVEALDRPELAGLLRRLGVRTLGEFAGLPAGDVLTRFGFDAALAQRLAAGADQRLLAVRRPPPDLAVAEEYDEPIDRVDVAAFAARGLGERLHDTLAGHGLACTRLGIEAVTAHGQTLHRTWRHDGLLTAAAITDRVRWQLEGWLSGSHRRGGPALPTSGIRRLRLVPEGVLAQAGLQPGLWGGAGDGRGRAYRALARVQGLLGPESVLTAVLRGGRSPVDQVRLVPWGDEWVDGRSAGGRSAGRPGGGGGTGPGGGADGDRVPWPGRLPAPAPATVFPEPVAATVLDAGGGPVSVDARLAVSAAPAWVTVGGAPPARVTGWAGPWPVDERWWAPAEARRVARFQVSLADGRALLLALSGSRWTVEASYD
jgi:protein ImuB